MKELKENGEGAGEARNWPRESLGMAEGLGKIKGEWRAHIKGRRQPRVWPKAAGEAAIARGSHGREFPASSSRAGAAGSGQGDG